MAIVNGKEHGQPDNVRNINTPEQWDKHYTDQPELLDEQLLGLYDLAIADTEDGAAVLDIGGAAGKGAAHMKLALPNSDICVMEISQVACDVGAARHPDIKFICADIRTVDLGECAYDCIIASQVIEHVDNLDVVMNKIMLALSSHGKLYIGVPHEDDLYVWHQHRFSHESYHYFKTYSKWVSFSSDGLIKARGVDQHMFIRLERD